MSMEMSHDMWAYYTTVGGIIRLFLISASAASSGEDTRLSCQERKVLQVVTRYGDRPTCLRLENDLKTLRHC